MMWELLEIICIGIRDDDKNWPDGYSPLVNACIEGHDDSQNGTSYAEWVHHTEMSIDIYFECKEL